LAQAAAPPGEGVRVALGGIPAWVRSPPDESGIVAFWLHVNPRARELPGPQAAEPLYGLLLSRGRTDSAEGL
jgi:hypothetical protein